MIIRVNGVLGSDGATEHLDGAVGEDFIYIHVCLCSGTGLVDYEGEV